MNDIDINEIEAAISKYEEKYADFSLKHGLCYYAPRGNYLTERNFKDGAQWIEFVEKAVIVDGRNFLKVYCKLIENSENTDGFESYIRIIH